MRYAQGGGLTDERRAFREELRMAAAERFVQADDNAVIAHDLRVSVRSVQRWRKAWSQDGPRALASGPWVQCRHHPQQQACGCTCSGRFHSPYASTLSPK
ncbi:helix-turn-helix domain-containing protein [Streptomyces sp. NPDC051956]|uniref:helix-turn-helix domain-containing protein n=1 Tax=Streptomyces sp. NPDC051956 TaxID=3365677 RepID=UPI0037D37689